MHYVLVNESLVNYVYHARTYVKEKARQSFENTTHEHID